MSTVITCARPRSLLRYLVAGAVELLSSEGIKDKSTGVDYARDCGQCRRGADLVWGLGGHLNSF